MPNASSNKRRLLPLISLLSLVLILGGCGDSEDTAEDVNTSVADKDDKDSKDKDAKGGDSEICTVLTDAEAEAALGGPVQKKGEFINGVEPSPTCTWSLKSDELTAFIVTELRGQAQVDLFEQKMEGDGPMGKHEVEIANLGVAAGCTPGPLETATLEVKTKRTSVLQLAGSTCEQLETLARAALPRLAQLP